MGHRKTRRVYDQALTYENVYSAWKTVSQTCKNRRGVFEFAMFGHARVAKILDELKMRKYWPNKYRCFMIFEPKARLVMSQSIRDKIVNHFVANEYLIPLLERTLVDTNVATRKKKGASYAGKMLKRYISQMQAERPGAKIYVLKIDISKYFYTIDHEILFQMLSQKVKDKDVLEILRRIISETNKPYVNKVIDGFNKRYETKIPHYETGKGLSIGAMTSQFLAIFYLNGVDRFVKEKLGCRFFIRYMDDIVLMDFEREKLRKIFLVVKKKIEELKLRVNPKSAIYNLTSFAGFAFLGYRYFVDVRNRLRIVPLAKTKRRIRRRLIILIKYAPEKYLLSRAAYKGYFLYTLPRVITY